MNTRLFTLLSISFIILIASLSVVGQDQIVLKNGEKIDCNIKELSDSQIKYTEIEDANQIIFSMSRGQVREIKFSYGKVITEKNNQINENYFIDDNRNSIKFNFLSVSGSTFISTYERAINPFSSWELSTKFIGIGFNRNNEDRGFAIDGGYKIKLKSLANRNGYRPNHLMHGGYLRGSLGVARTTSKQYGWNVPEYDVTQNMIHLGLDIGKQWIIQNIVALDIFIGYHYFGSAQSSDNAGVDDFYGDSFSHGNLAGSDNVAVSFGMRIGVVFGKYGENGTKTKKR